MNAEFKHYFPTPAANIENCRQLTPEHKKRFDEHCSRLSDDATLEDVAAHVQRGFFWQTENQFLGKLRRVPDNMRIGRLHWWAAIARAWTEITSQNEDTRDQDFIGTLKDRYIRGDDDALLELLEELESAPMGPSIVWGFVFPLDSRPSANDWADLPCRLGLNDLSMDSYVRLELHPPKGVKPKYPTAFDAGLDDYWAPGGATKPRDACHDKQGLPEVIVPSKVVHPDGLTFGDARPL